MEVTQVQEWFRKLSVSLETVQGGQLCIMQFVCFVLLECFLLVFFFHLTVIAHMLRYFSEGVFPWGSKICVYSSYAFDFFVLLYTGCNWTLSTMCRLSCCLVQP